MWTIESGFRKHLGAPAFLALCGAALAQAQSWQAIGERGAYLVATDQQVSVISTDQNRIWKYDGTPDRWTKIGDRARQLAASSQALFVISTDADGIWARSEQPSGLSVASNNRLWKRGKIGPGTGNDWSDTGEAYSVTGMASLPAS